MQPSVDCFIHICTNAYQLNNSSTITVFNTGTYEHTTSTTFRQTYRVSHHSTMRKSRAIIF